MAKPKTYEITTVVTEWKRTRMYYSKGTLKELIEATRNTFEAGQASKEDLIAKTKDLLERYPNAYLQHSTLLKGDSHETLA